MLSFLIGLILSFIFAKLFVELRFVKKLILARKGIKKILSKASKSEIIAFYHSHRKRNHDFYCKLSINDKFVMFLKHRANFPELLPHEDATGFGVVGIIPLENQHNVNINNLEQFSYNYYIDKYKQLLFIELTQQYDSSTYLVTMIERILQHILAYNQNDKVSFEVIEKDSSILFYPNTVINANPFAKI